MKNGVKIKVKIVDIIRANKMIKEMIRYQCTPNQMLTIINLAKRKLNKLHKKPFNKPK